jgi:hypothetical protein
MIPSLHASAAAAGTVFSVSIDESGSVTGFRIPVSEIGSISPANFKGLAVQAANSGPAWNFGFSLEGTTAQDFISYVRVQTTAGTVVQYDQADATFEASGGLSTWTWPIDQSGGAFTATTPTPRSVTVV